MEDEARTRSLPIRSQALYERAIAVRPEEDRAVWTPTAEPTAEAQAQLGPLGSRRLELRDDIGRISEEQWKWLLKARLRRITNVAE